MNLNIYKISDKSYLKKIYKEHMKSDFPPDEMKPLSIILRGIQNGSYECFGLFDTDINANTDKSIHSDADPWLYELMGYAVFVKQSGERYLLDYFAITEKHRNEGLGSVFLGLISESMDSADSILCEVEDPDKATDADHKNTMINRINFYLRNGFIKTEITVNLYGVNYRILQAPVGKEHKTEEMREIYEAFYREKMPAAMFRKFFRFT